MIAQSIVTFISVIVLLFHQVIFRKPLTALRNIFHVTKIESTEIQKSADALISGALIATLLTVVSAVFSMPLSGLNALLLFGFAALYARICEFKS